MAHPTSRWKHLGASKPFPFNPPWSITSVSTLFSTSVCLRMVSETLPTRQKLVPGPLSHFGPKHPNLALVPFPHFNSVFHAVFCILHRSTSSTCYNQKILKFILSSQFWPLKILKFCKFSKFHPLFKYQNQVNIVRLAILIAHFVGLHTTSLDQKTVSKSDSPFSYNNPSKFSKSPNNNKITIITTFASPDWVPN